MNPPADKRILGLSPRARRVVLPFLAIAAILVTIAYFSSGGSAESSRADAAVAVGPYAGGDSGARAWPIRHGGELRR